MKTHCVNAIQIQTHALLPEDENIYKLREPDANKQTTKTGNGSRKQYVILSAV